MPLLCRAHTPPGQIKCETGKDAQTKTSPMRIPVYPVTAKSQRWAHSNPERLEFSLG